MVDIDPGSPAEPRRIANGSQVLRSITLKLYKQSFLDLGTISFHCHFQRALERIRYVEIFEWLGTSELAFKAAPDAIGFIG
jgi:hypothetical protein